MDMHFVQLGLQLEDVNHILDRLINRMILEGRLESIIVEHVSVKQ